MYKLVMVITNAVEVLRKRTWNRMERREMSLGSLRYIVHQHAPLEYKEVCKYDKYKTIKSYQNDKISHIYDIPLKTTAE